MKRGQTVYIKLEPSLAPSKKVWCAVTLIELFDGGKTACIDQNGRRYSVSKSRLRVTKP